MKAMILVVSPKECVNLLNDDLSLLVRKKFPKDYVGWVYIYVTEDNKNGWCMISLKKSKKHYYQPFSKTACYSPLDEYIGNGKVVARFWCDKVEEHKPFCHWCIEKETCLTRDDVLNYLDNKDKSVGNPKRQGKVYAIHIIELVFFIKQKELSEFCKVGCLEKAKRYIETCSPDKLFQKEMPNEFKQYILTRAPRNGHCYIEV